MKRKGLSPEGDDPMETMIGEREKALWLVASTLAEYEADVNMEVVRSDGTITIRVIRPEDARPELLQWAKRISDRYDDVLRRLAQS